MLIKAQDLKGYKLHGTDGEIGSVREFFFDDKHWAVRYLVAETGHWLSDRQVLISPYAMLKVNQQERSVSINLSKKQIEASPSIEAHKPVSRQYEEVYASYYGWPMYWGGPFMWGALPYIMHGQERQGMSPQAEHGWDAHLRSTHDLSGHAVLAKDGEIGHVADVVVDDKTWAIRYLIIATTNWWPGKHVLVSPRWVLGMDWDEKTLSVSLTRDAIERSPTYNAESLILRDYETKLHGHYSQKGYWLDESPV